MRDLDTVLLQIRQIADLTPEYEDEDVASVVEDALESLLCRYPGLRGHTDYLAFLRRTGGAHISNASFSLGIFGVGGYVVPSFDEGEFQEGGRFLQFADVMLGDDPELVLAFDLASEGESVCLSDYASGDYQPLGCDFLGLLQRLSRGDLALLERASCPTTGDPGWEAP